MSNIKKSESYFVVALLLFSLYLYPVIGYCAENSYYHVGVEKGKLRSGPATSYEILWLLPRYYPLEYLAKYENWLAVRVIDNTVGWIHKDSLAEGKGAIVTLDKINIRKESSTKSKILFSISKNYTVKVLKEEPDWIKISDQEGETGWAVKRGFIISK